jgi:hypothetical protein
MNAIAPERRGLAGPARLPSAQSDRAVGRHGVIARRRGCRKIVTPGRLFVTALQGRPEAASGVPRTAALRPLRDDRARWQVTLIVSRSHRQIIFRQPPSQAIVVPGRQAG